MISQTVLTLEKLSVGLLEMCVDNESKNKVRRRAEQKNCRHINQDKKRLDLLETRHVCMFVEVNSSRAPRMLIF